MPSKSRRHRARSIEPTFRVKQGLYIIGSLERGLTVHKQQVRAHNLVWSLWELYRRKKIKIDSVAIVGGGIAGLTAAACFLSRFGKSVSVTLFEQLWDLCPLQQGSDNRWLHPKIYEWPAYGSRAPGASLPVLNWSEGRASDVARTILSEFRKFAKEFCERDDQLTVYLALQYLRLNAAKNEIEWLSGTKRTCEFVPIEDGKDRTAAFSLIVLAAGFGLEKGLVEYRTDSYWRNEQLGQLMLDVNPEKFVISGFGDGALIDLCRLTIERYRQDTILYELFPDNLEKVEEQLAAEWKDPGANAFEFFGKIQAVLAPAQNELMKRIRKDTGVVLHIAGKRGEVKAISDIFGPTSSFQNRMMTFLLYSCKAFIPTTDRLETVVREHHIPESNVFCRYGTDALAHMCSMFIDVDQVKERLVQLKARQEQSPRLSWEPGTFPQERMTT